MKRLVALIALLLVALPGTAYAESAGQVAAALRNSRVYQSQGLDLVDVATLQSELNGSDPQVEVAVLAAKEASSAQEARQRAVEIGRALGDTNAVVLVVAGEYSGAGAGRGAVKRGVNAPAALTAELDNIKGRGFTKENLTAFVTSFKERIADQASGGASSSGSSSSSSGGSSHGGLLLAGIVAIGGGAAALVVGSSRRRKTRLNEGLRADVE